MTTHVNAETYKVWQNEHKNLKIPNIVFNIASFPLSYGYPPLNAMSSLLASFLLWLSFLGKCYPWVDREALKKETTLFCIDVSVSILGIHYT